MVSIFVSSVNRNCFISYITTLCIRNEVDPRAMNNIDVITNIKVKHVLAKFSCIDSRPSEDFLDNAKNLEEI